MRYWITRATTEGVRWLDELIAAGAAPSGTHPGAYFVRGFLAVLQGDPAAAVPALERCVSAARETAHPRTCPGRCRWRRSVPGWRATASPPGTC